MPKKRRAPQAGRRRRRRGRPKGYRCSKATRAKIARGVRAHHRAKRRRRRK